MKLLKRTADVVEFFKLPNPRCGQILGMCGQILGMRSQILGMCSQILGVKYM